MSARGAPEEPQSRSRGALSVRRFYAICRSSRLSKTKRLDSWSCKCLTGQNNNPINDITVIDAIVSHAPVFVAAVFVVAGCGCCGRCGLASAGGGGGDAAATAATLKSAAIGCENATARLGSKQTNNTIGICVSREFSFAPALRRLDEGGSALRLYCGDRCCCCGCAAAGN